MNYEEAIKHKKMWRSNKTQKMWRSHKTYKGNCEDTKNKKETLRIFRCYEYRNWKKEVRNERYKEDNGKL